MRYVILLVMILVAVLFYRWRRARNDAGSGVGSPKGNTRRAEPIDGPRRDRPQAAPPPEAGPGQSVRTARCAECGLVLPEKEAVRLNGQAFCSAQHAHRWQERQPR